MRHGAYRVYDKLVFNGESFYHTLIFKSRHILPDIFNIHLGVIDPLIPQLILALFNFVKKFIKECESCLL